MIFLVFLCFKCKAKEKESFGKHSEIYVLDTLLQVFWNLSTDFPHSHLSRHSFNGNHGQKRAYFCQDGIIFVPLPSGYMNTIISSIEPTSILIIQQNNFLHIPANPLQTFDTEPAIPGGLATYGESVMFIESIRDNLPGIQDIDNFVHLRGQSWAKGHNLEVCTHLVQEVLGIGSENTVPRFSAVAEHL